MVSMLTIIIVLTAAGFVVFAYLSLLAVRNSRFDAAQLFERHVKEILALPGMRELLAAAKFEGGLDESAEKPVADDRVNAATEK